MVKGEISNCIGITLTPQGGGSHIMSAFRAIHIAVLDVVIYEKLVM